MEFCPELAIFHSSINLADRIYQDRLSSFVRDGVDSEKALQVVRESVEEISRGLAADITAQEADRWNLMLTALSTWKSISCIPELNVIRSIPLNVVRLLRPLPHWSGVFYYELIKRNSWENHCMRVLDVLEISVGISLLKLILNQFNSISVLHFDDLRVAVATIEYLCLVENKYLPCLIWNVCCEFASEVTESAGQSSRDRRSRCSTASSSYNQKEMIQKFMCFEQSGEGNEERNLQEDRQICLRIVFEFMKRMTSVEVMRRLSDGDKVRLLSSLFSFLSMLIGSGGYVLQRQCLFEETSSGLETADSSAKKTISSSSTFSSVCSDDRKLNPLILLTVADLPLAETKPPHNFTFDSVFVDDLIEIFSSADDFARNFTSFEKCLCQTKPNDFHCLFNLNTTLFLVSCQYIFVKNYCNLQKCLEKISDVKLKQNLQSFLTSLHVTYSGAEDFIQDLEACNAQPTQIFERALLKIEQKSPDAKDHFIWLVETCSEDVFKDPRWLRCIEICCDAPDFLDETSFVRVLSSMHRIKHELDEEAFKRFQLAVVKAYRCLSLDCQNFVLDEIYGKSTMTPFEVDTKGFQQHFTELFRELTSADKPGFQDKIKEVSSLVLQSPQEAVNALVSSVIQNKQYAEVFVEVLRAIPLMAKLESHDGCLAVFDCIQTHLQSDKLTKMAKNNVLSLYRHLLTADASREPLCCTEKFLRTCVFSRQSLLTTALESESEISSVILTLNSLLIGFESLDQTKITWSLIESHAVLPLIVWLCHVIDCCRDLWPRNCSKSFGRIKVKEMTLKTLNLLLLTLGQCKEKMSDDHCRWLWRQLSQLHWTVIHYVQPLLVDLHFSQSIFPLHLSEFLSRSCDRLTERRLYMLLDVCRVSEDSAQHVLDNLQHPNAFTVPLNFYPKMVYCLSEILFNSIKSEWFCIAKALKQLAVSDFVPAKISSINELCVCNAFVDAILLKKEMSHDDTSSSSISMWMHVVQCFSEYFKESVLKDFHPEDQMSFAKSCLYVVTRLWLVVPNAASMPLFNLILEVCTVLTNLINSTDADYVTRTLVQNAITEVNQTVQLCH